MRILTNVTKAELDNLTSQPTAKAMIDKVKTEGKYIAEGDKEGAAAFVAARKQQQEDALHISNEGMAALQKSKEAKSETTTTNTDMVDRELEKLKEKKTKLEQELLTADETKRQELQMQLDQVNMELTLKNNDAYRRQHSVIS